MKNLITRIATGTALILSFIIFFIFLNPVITSLTIILALLYIIFFEYPKLFNYKSLRFWLVLPFYPVLPFLLAAYMSCFTNYRELIFYLIVLAQIHDIGGYVFGSLFGKHKLAPKLSPKKSLEGFFGGYLFVILTLTYILFLKKTASINSSFSRTQIIFILAFSILISIFATAGDLLESWLKRNAGIKDTGNALPGHGGFLDRFDSCMLIIFIFFIFKDYLLKIFNI